MELKRMFVAGTISTRRCDEEMPVRRDETSCLKVETRGDYSIFQEPDKCFGCP